MTFNGHIEHGRVVFDGPLNLPNGTEVTMIVSGKTTEARSDVPSLYERLKPIIGIEELPPTMRRELDDLLYGRGNPKTSFR